MSDKKQEDWINKKWRPMMAVMYMVVCVFDFVLFPIGFTAVQFWEVEANNDAFRQWQPLTLIGGGLFHVAMGAVLGVTAWSRGQEKMAGVATPNNPVAMQTRWDNQDDMMPVPSNTSRYNNNYYIVTGYGGKKGPPPAYEPAI